MCHFGSLFGTQKFIHKILCLPFHQEKLERTAIFVSHEWFFESFFLILSRKRNAQISSEFVSMNAITLAYNLVFSDNLTENLNSAKH